MSDKTTNDPPCECGETTIRDCATRPSRHCGMWQRQDNQHDTSKTTEHDELVERVAAAICKAFGDDWGEAPESALGAGPGSALGKADFREMASEAIAVVRQWDAGK